MNDEYVKKQRISNDQITPPITRNTIDEYDVFDTSDQKLLEALLEVEGKVDEFDDFEMDNEMVFRICDQVMAQSQMELNNQENEFKHQNDVNCVDNTKFTPDGPRSPSYAREPFFSDPKDVMMGTCKQIPARKENELEIQIKKLKEENQAKSGELAIVRHNMSKLNSENMSLRETLIKEQQTIREQYASSKLDLERQLQEAKTKLKFKEQELLSLRMGSRTRTISKGSSFPVSQNKNTTVNMQTVAVETDQIISEVDDEFFEVDPIVLFLTEYLSKNWLEDVPTHMQHILMLHQITDVLPLFIANEVSPVKCSCLIESLSTLLKFNDSSVKNYVLNLLRILIESLEFSCELILNCDLIISELGALKPENITQYAIFLKDLAFGSPRQLLYKFEFLPSKIICQMYADGDEQARIAILSLLAIMLEEPKLEENLLSQQDNVVAFLCNHLSSQSDMVEDAVLTLFSTYTKQDINQQTKFKSALIDSKNFNNLLLACEKSTRECQFKIVEIVHELFLTFGDASISNSNTRIIFVSLLASFLQDSGYSEISEYCKDLLSWIVKDYERQLEEFSS